MQQQHKEMILEGPAATGKERTRPATGSGRRMKGERGVEIRQVPGAPLAVTPKTG